MNRPYQHDRNDREIISWFRLTIDFSMVITNDISILKGKTTFSFFIYKTAVLKEFGEIRGCCISKEQWGWAGAKASARRSPGEAGEEASARCSRGRAGEETSDRRSREGAGEKAPARRSRSCGRRASFRRGGNPPDTGLTPPNPAVSDAHGTVDHRESTILKVFQSVGQ